MRPEDIALLSVPTSLALHGDLLVASLARPDPAANKYVGGLVRVPMDGAEPSPLTWGSHDAFPSVSPDGRLLAFTRPVADENGRPLPQLHVLPVAGGEVRCLTSLPLGVGKPAWAPDSSRIACTARIPEPGRYGTADPEWESAPKPDEEAPRRITRLDYGVDNVGYVVDRHSRLFVLDVPPADEAPPEPVELTDGRCDVLDPAWTPDGEYLIVAAPRDLGERETLLDDLYAVPSNGGEPLLVAQAAGSVLTPTVTDDGLVLFNGVALDGGRAVAVNHGLWATEFRPGQPSTPRRLTDVETVDLEPASGPPLPLAGDVVVPVRNRGAVELRSVPIDATGAPLDTMPLLIGEHGAVRGFTVADDRIAAVVSTPDSPGEVVLGDGTCLTDFAAPLRAADIRPTVEITGAAPDGYPVHGWVVLPDGIGPHPVVLFVHGGPFMYHGWGFLDEAQILASAGYAVVLPNPRGSAGYGQAHGASIVRALTTVDVDDILATLDVALELPELDGGQVGVMGGSYGGFMTGWLAGHHGDRFRAAWSERAVNAWDSFTGSSDIGWFFTDDYIGSDLAEQRRLSPLTYADRIDIPFAVVHSENDLRCPFEQAQRMFVALKRGGVDAELLVFPGEGHELTRSGKPRHRLQRFRVVLDWWARHLKVS
jgi:dipeptidyl aminopeptidase/acylaminoacyl peptidase